MFLLAGGAWAVAASGAIAAPAFRATAFRTKTTSATFTNPSCSQCPMNDIQSATKSGNNSATGQEIGAGVALPGGMGGGIFVQQSQSRIAGSVVNSRVNGVELNMDRPDGTGISAGVGLLQLTNNIGGSESGFATVVKVKVPVMHSRGGQISFEVGEQINRSASGHSEDLRWGVTGGFGGGGEAASAPKAEPMQTPKLASVRPSDQK